MGHDNDMKKAAEQKYEQVKKVMKRMREAEAAHDSKKQKLSLSNFTGVTGGMTISNVPDNFPAFPGASKAAPKKSASKRKKRRSTGGMTISNVPDNFPAFPGASK